MYCTAVSVPHRTRCCCRRGVALYPVSALSCSPLLCVVLVCVSWRTAQVRPGRLVFAIRHLRRRAGRAEAGGGGQGQRDAVPEGGHPRCRRHGECRGALSVRCRVGSCWCFSSLQAEEAPKMWSLSCRFICSKFCLICFFVVLCQRYVLLVENRFQGS